MVGLAVELGSVVGLAVGLGSGVAVGGTLAVTVGVKVGAMVAEGRTVADGTGGASAAVATGSAPAGSGDAVPAAGCLGAPHPANISESQTSAGMTA